MTFIIAPNKSFTGKIGSDQFVDGICDFPSEEQLPYYKRQGFHITESLGAQDAEESSEEAQEINSEEDFPKPSPDDLKQVWVDYAQAQGLDVDGLTKDEIIDRVEATQE